MAFAKIAHRVKWDVVPAKRSDVAEIIGGSFGDGGACGESPGRNDEMHRSRPRHRGDEGRPRHGRRDVLVSPSARGAAHAR